MTLINRLDASVNQRNFPARQMSGYISCLMAKERRAEKNITNERNNDVTHM